MPLKTVRTETVFLRDERNYTCWWIRNAIAPNNAIGKQAADAGV